jgi:type IV secretion system protein VirD4
MSGKMVRNPAASQPAALAFLFFIGLVVSMGIGALAVLWQAHLLSAHTPWARVPGALWALRAAPIVWKPFLGGFALAFMSASLASPPPCSDSKSSTAKPDGRRSVRCAKPS